MLLGLLAVLYAFGVATWTAGGAIRHRNKVFPLLLIFVALAKTPARQADIVVQTEGEKSE